MHNYWYFADTLHILGDLLYNGCYFGKCSVIVFTCIPAYPLLTPPPALVAGLMLNASEILMELYHLSFSLVLIIGTESASNHVVTADAAGQLSNALHFVFKLLSCGCHMPRA